MYQDQGGSSSSGGGGNGGGKINDSFITQERRASSLATAYINDLSLSLSLSLAATD